jgi:hypothetical protein
MNHADYIKQVSTDQLPTKGYKDLNPIEATGKITHNEAEQNFFNQSFKI